MPIDEFGKNVLGKLGWSEGKGVGRTQAQQDKPVHPIAYNPRQHRLGLGAKPLSKEQLKALGGGDDLDKRRLAVTQDLQADPLSGGRNYSSIHAKL